MVDKAKIYDNMPQLIKGTLLISEGWLVGGAVTDLSREEEPHDYDIIVENPRLYQRASEYLRTFGMDMDLNSFGGLKFCSKGKEIEIDMWVCSVGDFFVNRKKNNHPAYSLTHGILLYSE